MSENFDPEDLIPSFEDTNESYLQYLEGTGGLAIEPLSPEGLTIQAAYLKRLGNNQHPIDVLRRISLNPFASPRDRISASKTLLEYTTRKVPSTMELTGAGGKPLSIGPEAMAKLSNDEIDQLLALLEKANAGLKAE